MPWGWSERWQGLKGGASGGVVGGLQHYAGEGDGGLDGAGMAGREILMQEK